jgi:hypothetical protein
VLRENPSLIEPTATVPSSSSDWSGLPILYDEVFTGLYRLGRFNCSSYLQADPDIIVNAKLLTGGLVPLCTTTASQSIFEAFLSDEKSDALLHGHSYTAHAVGCNVAVESLNTMMEMEKANQWGGFKASWDSNTQPQQNANSVAAREREVVWSMWTLPFLDEISHKPSVDHVKALGSVLAVALKDEAGAGKSFSHIPFFFTILLPLRGRPRFLTTSRLHINCLANPAQDAAAKRRQLVHTLSSLGQRHLLHGQSDEYARESGTDREEDIGGVVR